LQVNNPVEDTGNSYCNKRKLYTSDVNLGQSTGRPPRPRRDQPCEAGKLSKQQVTQEFHPQRV